MDISKLGEFGLIGRIKKQITVDASVVQGIGDDCAVISNSPDNYLLYTCDMMVEGVDFTRRDDPALVGRKALAISISDIAACGGTPSYCLVSLGLPVKTPVACVDRLYNGITAIARQFKINVVGGDISAAGRLVLDVSMVGFVKRRHLALRSGARPGDILFVTGSFGGSIHGKHLRFVPRLAESQYLVRNFRVHAMIDVSDGLLQDLNHILEQSGVGVILYEDLIPVDPSARDIRDALTSGEDFELLFALPLEDARRLRSKSRDFTAIGQVIPARYGATIVDTRGRKKKICARGFRHF